MADEPVKAAVAQTLLEVMEMEEAQLEAQMKGIQERLYWIRSMKRRASAPMNGTQAGVPKAAPTRSTPLPGASVNDMIMQFVQERQPEPVSRKEIVEYILPRTKSTSKNKRQMMFGYITGLVMKEHLRNNGPGEVALGTVAWNPKRRNG